MYKPTKALSKLASLKKKVRVIQGSQGAGKTIGIIMQLINSATHHVDKKKSFEVTIAQYQLSKAKKTVVRDFIKIMVSLGTWDRKKWNKSDYTYYFSEAVYIEFIGLDEADIGKGFRRDVVYFNEVNKGNIDLETFTQFASRAKLVFADYNPDRHFWIHDDIIPDAETDFLILTFNDNEHLPQSEVDAILKYREKGFYDPFLPLEKLFEPHNIKNSYWANKWKVYGLGLKGSLEGQIFENWFKISRVPPEARYISTGLDFGFSSSPAAIVDHYVYNGKHIYNEVLYKVGLHNSDLAKILKQGDNRRIVYADSAEPKSISEIARYGVRIYPTYKGTDSIVYGIDLLQEEPMYITQNSKNLIFELTNYVWDTEKTKVVPVKLNDHAVDAIRYDKLGTHKRGAGVYHYS